MAKANRRQFIKALAVLPFDRFIALPLQSHCSAARTLVMVKNHNEKKRLKQENIHILLFGLRQNLFILLYNMSLKYK